VTICCFGDGASNIGAFHEALNLSAVWKLPVIWMCQNNRYGEHTPIERHQTIRSISERATAYAIPGVTVDGNDPVAVNRVVTDAAARARAGEGPTLVEAMTYRLYGHVFGDPMNYVEKSELEAAWSAEPTGRFRSVLEETGVLDAAGASEIDSRVKAEVSAALAAAIGDPEPDDESLLRDVTSARAGGIS
jgi:pyruvate dehydrogenase E1 component alpha subunit